MPFVRLRKFRQTEALRELAAQTRLAPSDFIMPYFVTKGEGRKEPIKAMPGIYRLSVDNLIEDIDEARALGVKAVLLFGVADTKDETATEAHNKKGIIQKAIQRIKKDIKDVAVITDVCLCGYTSCGHCGIIKDTGRIDNDATIKILSKIALSHASAGADIVAPSAMMDGQVSAIRHSLDKGGFNNVGILGYSAKYASNFYWPFREALNSKPKFGDRKSYQMDFRNSDEALREIEQDISEGADMVMVKPALAYLDIIYRAKESFDIPLAAYNVSGEYALANGKKDLILEILTGIKRAGADLIISYHAKEAAKWLRQI